jgi:hypothetical protein
MEEAMDEHNALCDELERLRDMVRLMRTSEHDEIARGRLDYSILSDDYKQLKIDNDRLRRQRDELRRFLNEPSASWSRAMSDDDIDVLEPDGQWCEKCVWYGELVYKFCADCAPGLQP